MNIIKSYIVNNDCYKNNLNKADSRYTTFQSRGPQGLMLHSVGCAQPSAQVFVNQWNRSGTSVAVHAVLQADGTVYQCMPWNYRGWHGGGSSNNTHIGVEMTEPSQIKYGGGATFTVTDRAAAQAQVKGTYDTAVQLFAYLCKQYNLNPLTQICSHAEGYRKGIATNHGDPEHLWRGLGMSYTMDGFRADVKKAMGGTYTSAKYSVGWNSDETGYWYSEDGNSYITGWKKIDGNYYYFDEKGYMLHDTTAKGTDGNIYKLNSKGIASLLVVGWRTDDNGKWYQEIDGTYPKNEWKEIDGHWFYFDAEGYMVHDYKEELNGRLYTFDSDGYVTVTEVVKEEEEKEVRYETLKQVPDYYRETLDKLIAKGAIKGRSGSGEDLVLDMAEDTVRVLVILDRTGIFD